MRVGLRGVRVSPADTWQGAVTFWLTHLAAGMSAAALLAWYLGLGNALASAAGVDWLRFSLHPWDGARLALAAGLVVMHAAAVWERSRSCGLGRRGGGSVPRPWRKPASPPPGSCR